MYRRIRIKNFRGLRDLIVDDLGRLNLFVGPNNVGKTSVLEALWLFQAPTNPSLTLNVAGFRGYVQPVPMPEPLWHGLFYDMGITRRIEIAGTRTDGTAETLGITLSPQWEGEIEPRANGSVGANPSFAPIVSMSVPPETLVYEYAIDGEPPAVSRFSLALGRANLQVDPAFTERAEIARRVSIFLAARSRTTLEELADRFTRAQDSVGVESLVRTLSVLQPGLTGLSIGFTLVSGQPTLRAQIAGLDNPVPLSLLGEGSARLTEILLAPPTVRAGLLLVDEVENGLYYRNMETAWRAIDAASSAVGTQVFATTHNAECVQAAVRALNGASAKDFRLYRLERADDSIRVVTYDHETAEAAFDFELEFR